jgi:hypothetical protein
VHHPQEGLLVHDVQLEYDEHVEDEDVVGFEVTTIYQSILNHINLFWQ